MIQGIGIDMIELDRIEKAVERNVNFPKRILTEEELAQFNNLKGHRRIEFLGGRFAAKEAYSKAVGTGIGKLSFQDISVQKSKEGAPVIRGAAGKVVHVSISHTKYHAIAQIIIESSSS